MKLRQLERSAAKAKAKKENKDFSTVWNEYRESKYVTKDEDGNVVLDVTPRNTQKKKQSHFDNGEQYFNMLNFYANLKNSVVDGETESVEVK